MDEKTREALEGSISKWEAIVDGTGADYGADNCPLCQMFYESEEVWKGCNGCPVKRKTGQSDCSGTPFIKWRFTIPFGQEYPYYAINDEQKSAAMEELEFLKSLRPTEDK